MDIAALLPHAGTARMIERVVRWDAQTIVAATSRHRAPDNPLRKDGRLAAVHLAEFGAQAMAIVGQLALRVTAGAAHPFQREGYRFQSRECVSEACDEPAFHRVAPLLWSLGAGAGLSF